MQKKGFTLIELLVVISIISFLSSIVLASLNTARAKARDARRMEDMQEIQKALELFANDHNGSYPSTGSMNNVYADLGCLNFVTSVSSVSIKEWVPGLVPNYIKELPQDPSHPRNSNLDMGNSSGCYMYSGDGKHYLLSAWGSVENPPTKMYSLFGFREPKYNSGYDELGGTAGQTLCLYNYHYFFKEGTVPLYNNSFTLSNLTSGDIGDCHDVTNQ